jgi:hypothetical protein
MMCLIWGTDVHQSCRYYSVPCVIICHPMKNEPLPYWSLFWSPCLLVTVFLGDPLRFAQKWCFQSPKKFSTYPDLPPVLWPVMTIIGLTSINEICVPRSILEICVGARVEQHKCNVLISFLARDEQGSHPVLVHRVDVRRLLQKFLNDWNVISASGNLK